MKHLQMNLIDHLFFPVEKEALDNLIEVRGHKLALRVFWYVEGILLYIRDVLKFA